MQHEYYTLLEIERTATADEIKRAYKKKAMELHPDRHGGDKGKEAEFKKINEAYATLSDPEKKAYYDRFGTTENMGGGFSGFQGGFDASDLGDIFSSFFGGGFRDGGKKREIGEDIEIRLSISLEDAIRGNLHKIEYTKNALCETCHGSGGKTEKCSHCGGRGRVRERMQTIFGVMEQERACPHCSGSGEIITEKCHTCHGKKYKKISVKKDIEIPAGIESGMSIKMRGEGHDGKDGSGDLYITFTVPEREGGLERDGHDLHYILKLSPAEGVLGCEKALEIPILGKKTLNIKAGTQSRDLFEYSGEGIPRLDRKGQKGRLIIHIEIEIPTKLSKEEKKLYEALLEIQGGKKADKGFFDSLF